MSLRSLQHTNWVIVASFALEKCCSKYYMSINTQIQFTRGNVDLYFFGKKITYFKSTFIVIFANLHILVVEIKK
jgi:hypothetical protein